MPGTIFRYPTADRDSLYIFEFVRSDPDDGYRCFILRQPDYHTFGSRSEGLQSTHRLSSVFGYFICFDGRIVTETAARLVAIRWAEATESYRKKNRFTPPSYEWAIRRLGELNS